MTDYFDDFIDVHCACCGAEARLTILKYTHYMDAHGMYFCDGRCRTKYFSDLRREEGFYCDYCGAHVKEFRSRSSSSIRDDGQTVLYFCSVECRKKSFDEYKAARVYIG